MIYFFDQVWKFWVFCYLDCWVCCFLVIYLVGYCESFDFYLVFDCKVSFFTLVSDMLLNFD